MCVLILRYVSSYCHMYELRGDEEASLIPALFRYKKNKKNQKFVLILLCVCVLCASHFADVCWRALLRTLLHRRCSSPHLSGMACVLLVLTLLAFFKKTTSWRRCSFPHLSGMLLVRTFFTGFASTYFTFFSLTTLLLLVGSAALFLAFPAWLVRTLFESGARRQGKL